MTESRRDMHARQHVTPQETARRMPRHAVRLPGHPVRRTLAIVLTAVVAFGVSGAVFAGMKLSGNITTVGDLKGLVAGPTTTPGTDTVDPKAGDALNILLLGSDDRSGENEAIGGEDDGMRSDTTLIAHISADRSRIDVVSIPRDSLVDIPACHLDYDPAGKMSKAKKDAMFNSAFSIGAATGDLGLAAACTMSTLQTATGITIDDFMLVDFAGFEAMVNAIGGVRVCVPEPLVDGKYTTLNLTAGWHDLQGADALNYVRARHVKGTDSSDLSRIERQKKFLGALARKVTSSEVLTSPTSLLAFLNAATKSLTTSQDLGNLNTLRGLGWSLRNVSPSAVSFVTVPNGPAASNKDRVQWTPKADDLWSRIIADKPLVDAPVTPAAGTSTAGTAAGATTPPATATTSTSSTDGLDIQTGVDADASACG